jgi:hypothetical protein
MKTFLCAMLILLILIGVMFCYTRSVLSLISELEWMTAALPPPTDEECSDAVGTLEAVWGRLRPLMRIGAHQRTVEQIELLIASMRVTAATEAETEFEISRAQLTELLRDLRETVAGTLWAIL